MRGVWLVLALVWAIGLAAAPPARAQAPEGPFAGWAAAVVAADWRDTRGQPIAAFENARRDLSAALVGLGFEPERLASLSLAPAAGREPAPAEALRRIEAVTAGARGCLLYFTSHGSPAGIVFGGSATLGPAALDALIDRWCGERPTVVVVSACYSGVFVPALAAPNRLVMTAARRDRSSFGCSEDADYPYFDGCVLEALPGAADLLALAEGARACVARRERAEGLSPPSEPQLHVGAAMRAMAPLLPLRPVSLAASP